MYGYEVTIIIILWIIIYITYYSTIYLYVIYVHGV